MSARIKRLAPMESDGITGDLEPMGVGSGMNLAAHLLTINGGIESKLLENISVAGVFIA